MMTRKGLGPRRILGSTAIRKALQAACVCCAVLLVSMPAGSTVCPGRTHDEAIKSADCIFVGRVVGFSSKTPPEDPHGYGIVFEVEKAWRGVREGKITLVSPDPFACGRFFRKGSRYLIFSKDGITDQTWPDIELPSGTADRVMKRLGAPIYEEQ
jgi:hypothetical protein